MKVLKIKDLSEAIAMALILALGMPVVLLVSLAVGGDPAILDCNVLDAAFNHLFGVATDLAPVAIVLISRIGWRRRDLAI